MPSKSADDIAQIIKSLDAEKRELLAEFAATLDQDDHGEVEAFKKSLVSTTSRREKAAAREKRYEEMDLEEQKRAFFGVGSPETETDKSSDLDEASEKFLKGAAEDYS